METFNKSQTKKKKKKREKQDMKTFVPALFVVVNKSAREWFH